MPAGMGLASCLEFHRDELARQRDLLASVWTWYLLPFVPGAACVFIGRFIEHPERWPWLALSFLFVALVFVGVGVLNTRVARSLQHKIDELEGR
jgi:hypothetical protein